ncbi:MAG TPA: hypothetical protein PKA00_03795 [Saprospiraceae bacterium]|nr:hypothetical protein [Saprospiraceae bacterium]HMQ82000.1 hypothetical protein [Saprospiraceae bacterium]
MMNQFKIPVALLALLLLVIGITFFSSHPNKVNYEIEGLVEVQESSPISVDVYVTDDPEITPADCSKLHRTSTFENGRFYTEYAADANSKVFLFLVKEGYVPVRHVLNTALQNGKSQKIGEKILIAGKTERLGLEHDYGDAPIPVLQTYKDECGSTPNVRVAQNEIVYLENIKYLDKVRCAVAQKPAFQANIFTNKQTYKNIYIESAFAVAVVKNDPENKNPQITQNSNGE